jgi:hypothetical protein
MRQEEKREKHECKCMGEEEWFGEEQAKEDSWGIKRRA